MYKILCTIVFVTLASVSSRLDAQVLYGSLVGSVMDPSQSAMAGAKIVVLNTNTAQKWALSSNSDGLFSVTSLPPGNYEVVVAADGFRTFSQRGFVVGPSDTVRVDVRMEVGAITESVQVTAAKTSLQTDTMDVRSEIHASELQNTPVPMTRNYQNLLVMIPGIAPPYHEGAASLATNPSRALVLNSNGSNAQSTAVRVDGITTWNNIRHMSGYIPALEAIEEVAVQANSFEAEVSFAGGAAVNVQIKSGTNEFHGSGFWFHNNQHLKARPYFLPASERKSKRIINQAGGTLGGPIIKNKLFFFVSYEATPDRAAAFRLGNIPTMRMRTGDFSGSTLPVFDPLTGNPDGSGRMAFAGNLLPAGRFSPIMKKIVDLTPATNIGALEQLGQNYFASGSFIFDRHQVDTKFTAQATSKLNLSGRVSYLDWHFDNPPFFGALGGTGIENRGFNEGKGLGTTPSMTFSAVYMLTPSIVIDGYAGYTVIENGVENSRLDENLGRDFLGIPGSNGTSRADGGWPGFTLQGFDTFGLAQNDLPWSTRIPQSEYVASLAWTKGNHNVRFGWDSMRFAPDSLQPKGNPGHFDFTSGVTGAPGFANNVYNTYASFLLGLPNAMRKTVRLQTSSTRTWAHSLYVRDKWQATRKLTMSLGLRWDYFALPTRGGGQGLEIYNFDTNVLKLCGVGSLPTNCGFNMSKRYFSPRLGIAYRPMDTLVIRAGYGIAWDPVNIARNALQSYPTLSSAAFPAANGFQYVAEIARGIPAVAPPSLGDGTITVPATVALDVTDPNFRRSYIQSWNLMLEKDLGDGWIGQIGYVGNRSLRLQNRWNTNYASVGGGTASQVLTRKFGRTARTPLFSDAGGFRGYYDSLQSSLQRRFSRGYSIRLSYTWSKVLGPLSGNEFGGEGYLIETPDYWPLISKVVRNFDRTHNFNAAFTVEAPFGVGKRWISSGPGAKLLGGWQFNGLFTGYTGAPFYVAAAGTSLNAPGNSQMADQIKQEVATIGSIAKWFDTTAFAPVTAVRFGTSGFNQLRGPGMINVDLSIYRSFRLNERLGVQFRAEMFNVSNTPHFGNPNSNISGALFGALTSITARGRDFVDERFVRFGLRLSF